MSRGFCLVAGWIITLAGGLMTLWPEWGVWRTELSEAQTIVMASVYIIGGLILQAIAWSWGER